MTMIFDFARFPILTTPRLRLRQMSHEDAEAIIAIFGAPESLRYSNQPPTDTPEKAVELIDWLNSLYETQRGVQWLPSCRDGEGKLDLIAKLKVPRIPVALCERACHDLRCRCGRGAILLDYRQSRIGSMLI